MRIAIAEIAQETGSFSPMRADLSDFEAYGLFLGDEILTRMAGVGPLGGFLEIATEQPQAVEIVPLIRAWGSAGGIITAATVDWLIKQLVDGLRSSRPVDAVFLSLHGAAASEADDDVEGLVLQAVREVVGPDLPVVVALDHHANITQKMIDLADLLVGHETQPHDPPATGRKAARLLFRMLHGEIRPCIAWCKIPLITPQDRFLTSEGPMREWFERARQMEQQPEVLDVSPYPMQPWLDVVEGGWSVIVHTNQQPALAQELAKEMGDLAWRLRDDMWSAQRVPVADAVKQAGLNDKGLVILSDTGDSVYGGAPGDNTTILRAFMEQPPEVLGLIPVVDAPAVRAAIEAGVGSEITWPIGGRVDSVFSQPVTVTARVAATSQGFVVDLHDRGVCDLRQTALLAVGNLRIALLDHRSFAVNHPVLYSHLGIDVSDARFVVLKTASNFQFFSRWRTGLIRMDSPGTTQSTLQAFDWKRLPIPTYPLHPLDHWEARPSGKSGHGQ